MSENLDKKDKILLDTTDSREMTDHFARLAPGDEVKGNFVATLDEAGTKVVTLSIQEITINDAGAVTMAPGEDDGDGDEVPASVSIMKDDNGTPEQEGADEVPEPMQR